MSIRPRSRLLIALMLALSGPAHADYKDVLETPALLTPLARTSPLVAITHAGPRLVAVGGRGHILLSDDGGEQWTQVQTPIASDLTAVTFPDPDHGWAVGHDGVILATSDGGLHWEKQLDGRNVGPLMIRYAELKKDKALLDEARQYETDGADKPFLDVWFADSRTGYAVGAFNLIFKTQDGGKSWFPLSDRTANPQRLHLYAIKPAADALYIAGEGGLLLRSVAGSDDFRTVKLPYSGSLFGLESFGPTLLVYGLRGTLFRSEDNGTTWSKVETAERAALVASALGADGRIAIAAQSGAVLVSEDGFRTFEVRRMKVPMPLSSLAAGSGDTLVLVGFRGVATLSLGEVPQ